MRSIEGNTESNSEGSTESNNEGSTAGSTEGIANELDQLHKHVFIILALS